MHHFCVKGLLLYVENIEKAIFHCFCGKAKLGVKIAEAGYFLSIPSAIERGKSFQKLVAQLPIDNILTGISVFSIFKFLIMFLYII
jgi:Tat protein secretion system quality control protein TatD with DNase activity